MKKNLALLASFVIIIVLVGVIIMLLSSGTAKAPTDNGTPTQNNMKAGIADLIVVDTPLINASISSPLTITGTARGNWYFEASFPVELKDANGNTIAEHYAEAQGDWMTTNFVPFTSSLTFPAQPAGSTGTLILHKDNPSGEPQFDNSVSIPVTF